MESQVVALEVIFFNALIFFLVYTWKLVDMVGEIVPRQNFAFVDCLNFLGLHFLRVERVRLALAQMADSFVHKGSLGSPIEAIGCFLALDETVD